MTLGEIVDKFRVWGFRGILNFVFRFFSNRRHARVLACLAKASKGTKPSRGITVIADVSSQVSLSKTMRDFILSLRDVGIPVQVYDTSRTSEIPLSDAAGMTTPIEDFNLRTQGGDRQQQRDTQRRNGAGTHEVKSATA